MKLLLSLVLVCSAALSQQAYISSPVNASTITSPALFQWNAAWNPSWYWLYFSQTGCNQSDLGAFNPTGTNWNETLPSGYTGTLWVTLWSQAASNNYTWACYTYTVGTPRGAFVTYPVNGTQLPDPTVVFQFTSTAWPIYASAGYNGVGSADIVSNVALNGPTRYSPGFLWSQDHPNVYVRLVADGVTNDFMFPLIPPNTFSFAQSSALPGQAVADDSSGASLTLGTQTNPDSALMLHRKVRLSDGSIVNVPRADLLTVDAFAWSHTESSGIFRYSYDLDNRQVYMFRLGDDSAFGIEARGTQPAGWIFGGVGWSAFKAPNRDSLAHYSLLSSFRPGLVPVFFQGSQANTPVSVFPKSRDNEAIANAAGIFENSVRKFAIGPVFPQGATRGDVLAIIKGWVEGYGFSFLAPLLDEGTLEHVITNTDFEREILSCLKAVY